MTCHIQHDKYMKRCLELAKQGIGNVSPNPMVGCVIVYNNRIIGEGYHIKYGENHAEVNAINSVEDKSLLLKSTLYVNLEPCSHFGKTPPCANLIIEHKIPHVVIGCEDVNPKVKGNGINLLQEAGCKVEVGILNNECLDLNKRFITSHKHKRPYIILKWAQTLDGFMDIKRDKLEDENTKKEYWISNDACKILVHKWRSEEDSIMIGTNTAQNDNPSLTTREWPGSSPIRIVIDKNLRLSESLNIFDGNTQTIVYTNKKKKSSTNTEYCTINFDNDIIKTICVDIYKRKIQSIIIEGGDTLLKSFINSNTWDEARVIIGNKAWGEGLKAPIINQSPKYISDIDGDVVMYYDNV